MTTGRGGSFGQSTQCLLEEDWNPISSPVAGRVRQSGWVSRGKRRAPLKLGRKQIDETRPWPATWPGEKPQRWTSIDLGGRPGLYCAHLLAPVPNRTLSQKGTQPDLEVDRAGVRHRPPLLE